MPVAWRPVTPKNISELIQCERWQHLFPASFIKPFTDTMTPKRKAQSLGLNRRVRPRREDKWNLEPESDNQQSDDDVSEAEVVQDHDEEDQLDAEEDEDSRVRGLKNINSNPNRY